MFNTNKKGVFSEMKRLLAFLLAVSLSALMLISCSETVYEPVESTEEERRVMMTLSLGNDDYTVKYELYRALFLAVHSEVDRGDESVWSGDGKDEYIEKIDALIVERAATIYSVFAVCKSIGIDLYSSEVDETVNEYIKVSVEGGSIGDYLIEGAGSYEKYLDALEASGLNYSTQDLIYRYTIGLEKISEYYKGDINSGVLGAIKYTRDDVKSFYDGDGAVRIIRAFFDKDYISESRAEQIRTEAARLTSEEEFASFITGYTTVGGSDIKNGIVIGKYGLDRMNYGELVDAAFEMKVGSVSELISVFGTAENGYCFIYKAEKSDGHFEKCYDSIADAYLENEIGKILNLSFVGLSQNASASSELSALDRAQILAD